MKKHWTLLGGWLFTSLFFAMLMMPFNRWLHSSDVIVLAEKITASPTPSPTVTEEVSVERDVEKDIIVKVSHYSPALGGVNCGHFVDGKCVSHLANGEEWEKYIDKKNTIACPPELKFGTKIKILGRTWVCRDRGSKITKTESGAYWVDQLVEDTVIPYGYEVEAQIIHIP